MSMEVQDTAGLKGRVELQRRSASSEDESD